MVENNRSPSGEPKIIIKVCHEHGDGHGHHNMKKSVATKTYLKKSAGNGRVEEPLEKQHMKLIEEELLTLNHLDQIKDQKKVQEGEPLERRVDVGMDEGDKKRRDELKGGQTKPTEVVHGEAQNEERMRMSEPKSEPHSKLKSKKKEDRKKRPTLDEITQVNGAAIDKRLGFLARMKRLFSRKKKVKFDF